MREFLHHLFIPRDSNNHRARILHIQPLFLFLFSFVLVYLLVPQLERTYPSVLGLEAHVSVDELVTLTNQERAKVGLGVLTLNPQLSQAAALKAQDMMTKNYWAHTAPDGTSPWVFIKSAGYSYVYAGENLARGFNTAPDAVNAWMASPGHRNNMLSANYKDVGFAVVTGTLTGDETVLIVEMFGTPVNTPAVASSQSVSAPTAILVTAAPTLTPVPTAVPVYIAEAYITPVPTIIPVAPSVSVTPFTKIPASQASNTPPLSGKVVNDPLIDTASTARTMAIALTMLFMAAFLLDMIVIRQKNIARVVSHNLDHLFFLGFVLLILLFYGVGAVL